MLAGVIRKLKFSGRKNMMYPLHSQRWAKPGKRTQLSKLTPLAEWKSRRRRNLLTLTLTGWFVPDHYAGWWGADCNKESRRKDLAISVVPSNKMIVSASRVKTATCTANAVTTAFVARSILVMSMWPQMSGRPSLQARGWTCRPTSWRHMSHHFVNCEGGCPSILGSCLRAWTKSRLLQFCINVHVSVQSGESMDNK